MSKDDVAKMIFTIQAIYPNHFQNYDNVKSQNMLDAWVMVFEDKDPGAAFMALKAYLNNDTKGFPPSPGQIIDYMRQLNPDTSMNEMEAWSIVEKAVARSGYHAEEEFNKLPQIIRRVVRNAARLKEWALMDLGDFQTIEQSNFMRSYRAELEHERNNSKLPAEMRPKLAEIKDFPLEIAEKKEEKAGKTPDKALDELFKQLRGV